MVRQFLWMGRAAWLKTAEGGGRRLRLYLLDLACRRLGVPALRPPPHLGGQASLVIEQRRLHQLAAQQVRVPQVLEASGHALILSDIGVTLASRLRPAQADERARLVAAAAQAILCVHVAGGYLGQPFARNIMLDAQGEIGFIDFEEDPLQVMELTQAQVRDWLIFAAGVSRYFPQTGLELANILATALASVAPEVREQLAIAAQRLAPVAAISARLGARARRISGAITALQAATRG